MDRVRVSGHPKVKRSGNAIRKRPKNSVSIWAKVKATACDRLRAKATIKAVCKFSGRVTVKAKL